MDKVIVVKNNDGTIGVIHPAPEMFDPESKTRNLLNKNGVEFKNDYEIWNYIIQKNELKKGDYYFTYTLELPSDRYFRNAWEHDEKNVSVSINIAKALEIKKNVFRDIRKPLLEKLDIDFMRALEQNLDASEINKKKQILRDVTAVKFPDNVDDLKNFMPDCLQAAS